MKRTKPTKAILIVSLATVLVVGVTWAYLSTVTNTKTNPFTFLSEGLDAELEEPAWDDANGQDLVPDTNVRKDPQIKNTGQIDEYVALKLTWQMGDGTTLTSAQMTLLQSLIDVQYCTTPGTLSTLTNGYNPAWSLVLPAEAGTPEQTWYYRFTVGAAPGTASPLAVGASTLPVFDNIYIKASITQAQYAWLNGTEDYTIPGSPPTVVPKLTGGFQIYIEGAAAQASVFDPTIPTEAATLRTDLYGLLN